MALIAGFYAFSTWAITQYYGPSAAQATAQAGMDTFFFTAAADVLGPWSVTAMEMLLMVSLLASALSFHNTINRYFCALGREGLLPHALASVHDRNGSPHVAGRVQGAIALLACVAAGLDPYAVVFAWTSAIAVIGILSIQILVSVAILAYFRREPHGLGLWTRAVAPILALAALCGAIGLVILNLPLLAGTDSPIVWSFPWLVAAVGPGVLRDEIGVGAEAVAGALDLDDDGMAQEPVEVRGCDDGIAEDLAPLGEAAIGGEDHGALLIAGVDELEEEVGAA